MAEPIATLNGLTLAGTEATTGVQWAVPRDGITGWWSSPAPRLSSSARARAHGSWVGDSFLSPRSIAITGWMFAPSNEAGEDAMNRLAAACSLAAGTLEVQSDAGTTHAAVLRSDDVAVSWQSGLRTAKWSVQMLAADPRRLGSALTATTGLPSTTGGLTIPFTLPATISAAVVSGQASLTNPGNMAGPVTLRIDGPITGPIVTHVNSGRQLIFATSLVLGVGEFVTVDMDRREVLAQGQSSRNGWITSRGWSSFEPGDNTWAFTSTGVATGGMLTVTATPAWM